MTARSRIALLRWPVAALLAAAAPLGAESLQFTVISIDSQDATAPVLKALNAIPGVRNARVEDWRAGTASVEVDGGFDRERLRTALRDVGFEAEFPGETRKGLQPLPEEVRRTLDIASASEGPEIELAKVLVPGKVTLLDYWASWCAPCHLLDARLQRLARAQPKLAVRRVNVAKFDNPVGKQAVREFGIRAIPYVRVYDGKGRFMGEDRDGNWENILDLVASAKRE